MTRIVPKPIKIGTRNDFFYSLQYQTLRGDIALHDSVARNGPSRYVTTRSVGTGIRVFSENGGSLEVTQEIAGHADPGTTKRYDRRIETVERSEIERVRI